MTDDEAVSRVADRFLAPLRVDPKTGLPGYPESSGDRALDRALVDAQSVGFGVSLVLCDLDHFGRDVNGAYGHHVGDRVLVGVAAALRVTSRPRDIVLRGDGDGFKTVMFDADLAAATAWAELARVGLTHVEVPPVTAKVTASFGVATSARGDSGESLYMRAFHAMHRAKALGRDNVQVAAG